MEGVYKDIQIYYFMGAFYTMSHTSCYTDFYQLIKPEL